MTSGMNAISLQHLVLLLVAASLLPLRDATTDEGTALVEMMQKWGVLFDGWVSGEDPCTPPGWSYIQCSDGHVVYLNVTNTGVSGLIPPEIGELTHLEVLDVSDLYNVMTLKNNSLAGPFPDTLAQCTNLRSFNASNIDWNMEFPLVLTKLTALEELYFSAGGLTGPIPDDFYNNLVNLQFLLMGNNKLTGSLQKLANLKNLVAVSIFQTDLTGTIPEELGNLTNLQYINFHACNLYGPLPDSFSRLTNMQNISLYQNSLTGEIPDSWKAMTAMRNMRIDQNYLSGQVPSWLFTDWVQLNYLYLTKNSFSGPAPDITQLNARLNASYTFYSLKWDCNYLDGPQPCLNTNCSAQTLSKIDAESFAFDKNCYSDASQKSLTQVSTCGFHSPNVSCSDFYSLDCPYCPSNQVPWPAGGKCVCRLATPSHHGGGVAVGAVVGGLLGLLAAFAVIVALLIYKRRKRLSFLEIFNVRGPKGDDYWEAPSGVERFSKEDLARVTQDFSDENMIGEGGFGKVFVGTLDDGKMVAIKRASFGGLQGTSEFRNEVMLLSRLHHRHLVKLEGFCDEEGLQILVYEFMKNGNLHAHLLGKVTATPLHWYGRLEIAYGVAQGLEYLHSFADPPVIHRDVKPSNILLDDNMVAKLADFGISKVSPEYETHVSTRPAGTAGYLDPDYFMRRQLTSASDVYAFGVVMLELVTGQEAIDHSRHEEFNLVAWVNKRFRTAGIVAIVDPLIEHDYSPTAFTEMAHLGLRCASFDRDERPSMKAVLATLEPLMEPPADYHPYAGKKIQRGSRLSFIRENPEELKLLDETGRSVSSEAGGGSIELMSLPLRPR